MYAIVYFVNVCMAISVVTRVATGSKLRLHMAALRAVMITDMRWKYKCINKHFIQALRAVRQAFLRVLSFG